MTGLPATSAFHDARRFRALDGLEPSFSVLREECAGLAPEAFGPSPDSLTTRRDGFDETGWLHLPLSGPEATSASRALAPRAVAVVDAVPGCTDACLSLFRPGTRLYPHRGERAGVLRCHLPLQVPAGDVGLEVGGSTRRWVPGRCLVFDDRFEHTAWNLGAGNRIVLLVTFVPTPASSPTKGEP